MKRLLERYQHDGTFENLQHKLQVLEADARFLAWFPLYIEQGETFGPNEGWQSEIQVVEEILTDGSKQYLVTIY